MERRQSPRVPLTLTVEKLVGDAAVATARTTDVSASGLRIEAAAGEPLADDRFAWLLLRLPPADAAETAPIRALAERRPGREGGQSYRIKYIYPRDRRRFEAFVRAAAEG